MDENKENALETTEEALPAELPQENGEASPAAVEETAEAEGSEEAEEEDGPALGYALAAWMDKRDDAKNAEESQKD